MPDRPVLLVAPHPADGIVSIAALAECLARELARRAEVVCPEARFARLVPAASSALKWMAYLDKFLVFGKHLRRAAKQAALIHYCDQACGMHSLRGSPVPQLLTCTDMIAVRAAAGQGCGQRPRWSGRQLQKLVVSGMKRCDLVACISEATRRDVAQFAGIGREKLVLAPMGLRRRFVRQAPDQAHRVLRQFGVTERFILHVGGNQWYKNRAGVIRIFAALPANGWHLVLAGKALSPELARLAAQLGCQTRLRVAENCSDEELEALYSCAELLLFPSLEEGFGWPIIEAQTCGCRVVTTDREPMSEAAGEAAVLIDPDRLTAAAAALHQVLCEPDSDRQAREAAGRRNSARYATERMISAYENLYATLLSDFRTGAALAA